MLYWVLYTLLLPLPPLNNTPYSSCCHCSSLTSDSNGHSNCCRTPGATIAAACSHGRQQPLRLLRNAHLWRLALHTLL
jgi:hypothetical protein